MQIVRWIKRGVLHVLPIFLFFLVFFTIINWIQRYLMIKAGIAPYDFIEIVIAAALIAKIVLVIDHLRIIHIFRRHPLIYGILWKTAFYGIILLAIRLILRFLPFFSGRESQFSEDLHHYFNEVNWHMFISIQVYYLMLLFIFVTFQELTIKIGPKRMRRLFFGK